MSTEQETKRGFDAQRWELTVFRLRYACERAAAALKTFNEVWEDGLRQERERWAESRAAAKRGPDDVLVLAFPTMTLRERDHFRSELPENLRDRVLFVAGADDVAVLRGGAK